MRTMAHHTNVFLSPALRLNSRSAARNRFSSFAAPRLRSNDELQRLRAPTWLHSKKVSTSSGETPTAEQGASAKTRSKRPWRRYAWITVLTLSAGCGLVYITDTRASAHSWIIPPALRWLYPDAEDAHHAGVDMLRALHRFGLHPRERGNPDGDGKLVTQVFEHVLCNPIGISGGLDKDAEIPSPLFELGPAIVEVGGTTPLPQPGNAAPRVFRVPSQKALINRYGLNSKGADHMASLLRDRVAGFAYSQGFGLGEDAERRVLDGEARVSPGSLTEGKLLAVQVAKNKATPDGDIEAIKRDYVYCVDRLGKYADILVVNVSSPNTKGLRDLQKVGPLTTILTGVVDAAKRADRTTKPHVMVKVSPDEDSDAQITGICDAVWASGVDGVIVGNTTNRRPKPIPEGYRLTGQEQATLRETGGFSGPHLAKLTVDLVRRYRTCLDRGSIEVVPSASAQDDVVEPHRQKVIFASGGITNGQVALDAINAGASVAMLYTGLVYGGSGTITRVKAEMREKLAKE